MTPIVLLIQGGPNDLFFNESFSFKLTRILGRKEKKIIIIFFYG